MFECGRCHQQVAELWATLEMFSRRGNVRDVHLCQHCSAVARAYILNLTPPLEDPMTMIDWSIPLNDPDDVDDAEHHRLCMCADCTELDADRDFEHRRDERRLA